MDEEGWFWCWEVWVIWIIALEFGKKAVLTLFFIWFWRVLKRRHFVLLFEHFVLHGENISFCGLYIKPRRTYVSSRTIGRFQDRVFGFRKQLDENKKLTYYDLERIEQVINSYLGFCVHHQSHQIRKENIINLGDNFWKYFYVRGHYESIRIRPDYRIFWKYYHFLMQILQKKLLLFFRIIIFLNKIAQS